MSCSVTRFMISALLLVSLAGLTACSSENAAPSGSGASAEGASPGGSAERVSGAEARRVVADENGFLLDVRTPGEFSGGHVDGATNIPVNELGQRLSEVPEDRPVVVYCLSGARSASAARMLAGTGRTVYDFGSYSAW